MRSVPGVSPNVKLSHLYMMITILSGLRVPNNLPSGRMLALDSCPMDRFDAALDQLVKMGLKNTSGVSEARNRYEELASANTCVSPLPDGPDAWFTNVKPLIINLGYGTTGTRWLTANMINLGYKTGHNIQHNCGTKAWNQYEYISDSPVAYQAWELIQSNPHATFILSMRDGTEWRESRYSNHNITQQASVCGVHSFADKRGQMESAATTVAYEAWIACLVPKDQLFAFNLWKIDKHSFLQQLKQFLERRGHGKTHWAQGKLLAIQSLKDFYANEAKLEKEDNPHKDLESLLPYGNGNTACSWR